MEKFNLTVIMKAAYKNRIGIPAFNIPYLPMVKPVADAIKGLESFGLLEVARPDVEKFGAKSYKAVRDEFNRLADRNFVRLHLDHTPVIDEDGKLVDWRKLIQEALDLGYESVMLDGSRLGLDENIKVVSEVVQMAHAKNVPVEAELGAVLGHEKGPIPPYEELFASGKGFTRPEDAERFVRETKVDWLSVAIGNIHGAITGAAKDKAKLQARLNIEHLKAIDKITNVPLVLHGGSGIKQQSVLDGIKNGITKINVGTNIRQPYEAALKERPGDIKFAQDAVKQEVESLIKDYYYIAGSARKLRELL